MAVWKTAIRISHGSLGGLGSNTFHARTVPEVLTPGPALQDCSDNLETFFNGLNDVLAGGTVCTHDGIWVRVDGDTPTIHTTDGWTSTSGTSQAPLPPATAMVVSWTTSLASRRARGRTFVGPLGVNTLEGNGTPTEPARAALDGHAETLVSASEVTNDWALGVWSELDQQLRDWVAASTANKFAVLRSRRD